MTHPGEWGGGTGEVKGMIKGKKLSKKTVKWRTKIGRIPKNVDWRKPDRVDKEWLDFKETVTNCEGDSNCLGK